MGLFLLMPSLSVVVNHSRVTILSPLHTKHWPMLPDMCWPAGRQGGKVSAQPSASVTMLSMLSQRPRRMSQALQALSALPV